MLGGGDNWEPATLEVAYHICQEFIERFLAARHCTRCWGYSNRHSTCIRNHNLSGGDGADIGQMIAFVISTLN